MKKIISFEKKIEFPTMLGEITSISLEKELNFISQTIVEGNFQVKGTYKLTEASCIEEPFNYKIPVEIILNEKLDVSTAKIEIDDFYYEIENEENLICYIDVLIEGVEELLVEEQPTQPPENDMMNRECDGDPKIPEPTTEQTNFIEEPTEVLSETPQKETERVESLFANLKDDDTFATYSVYILRQEETLQTILDKYKVTKDELEDYNDLSSLTIGSKIIIPFHDHNK